MRFLRMIGLFFILTGVVPLFVMTLWSGLMMFVFWEGRGGDRDFVGFIQPPTCVLMCLHTFGAGVGVLLTLWPEKAHSGTDYSAREGAGWDS